MATRREVVAQFIPHSPLARHLGIEIERTCFCTVSVTDDDGTVVASGLATYRFA